MSPFIGLDLWVKPNKYYFDIDEMKLPYGYSILCLLN